MNTIYFQTTPAFPDLISKCKLLRKHIYEHSITNFDRSFKSCTREISFVELMAKNR